MRNFGALLSFLVLALMPQVSSAQETEGRLIDALELQERAVGDPLFRSILESLDGSGTLDWREGNLKRTSRGGANTVGEVSWLFDKIDQKGLAQRQNIRVVSGRRWPDFTYAKSKACKDRISIKRSAIDERDSIALVNTLVHERVHSYCHLHRSDTQRRIHNMCDISYVAGDLAEAVLAHRTEGQSARRFADTSVCPALCKALEETGITICQEQHYEIVGILAHDTGAFTQGLIFADGMLFESTGRYGRSDVRRVVLETGSVEARKRIGRRYFGEGLTTWSNNLVSLTWKAGLGFVWDPAAIDRLGMFVFEGTRNNEGWGLTTHQDSLIMSDGSNALSIFEKPNLLSGEPLRPDRLVRVTLNGEPLCHLNELEFAQGHVFANVWQSNIIVRIDIETGIVNGIVDLTDIVENTTPAGELNGIAYDATDGRFFVTGKEWDSVFVLRFGPMAVSNGPQELGLKTPLRPDNFCQNPNKIR